MNTDEFDFSEPKPTMDMEMDETLCLTASDADLNISSLAGENLSGCSQPAPSDQFPLTRETQPGLSQSASSNTITLQNAPILQPVVIPQPQLSQEELIRVRQNLAEQERIRITMEQQGKLIITMQSELISLKRSAESGPEDITQWPRKPELTR